MNMYSFIRALVVLAVVAWAAPSSATIIPGSCDQSSCRDDLVGTIDPIQIDHILRGPGTQYAQNSTTAPTPTTQNTITTTAPVSSETTISVGTLAGQVLNWLAVMFGVPIGTLATALLWRLFQSAGLQLSDGLRQRLQQMIVNGLNAGAKEAENRLAGKGTIEIKNEIVAKTVDYVQDHGADTLKKLGIDPNSNAAVDAIKARIETAINDANQPTPAILTKPTPAV